MDPKIEKDISCPVCTEIYKEPVILTCSHSFCKECLQQFWEVKGSRECPVCRKRSNECFLPNLALQNLCETLSETSLQDRKRTRGLCEEHNCKLEFSQDEKPVCPECRDSKLLQHHNPSEEAAFELKTADQQDDLSALLTDSGEPTLERAIARAKETVDRLDNVVLNIAVTGESGTGKSSFVNAIRGLNEADEGAAPVGEVECTVEATAFPHPNMPNVKIWDLPGIGTSTFNASRYIEKVNFQNYDFFIIVSAGRFRENDIKLSKEIRKKKKNFYFVRSKIDIDVANAGRRKMNEEETLQQIRDNCAKNLSLLGPPPVFLITSHDLTRFDFPKLIDTLERDLPDHKRDALVLTLPVYSQQSLEKKYKKFKKSIWALAALSCGIGAAPVPGLSTACDTAIVVSFLTKCYHSFGLDDKSLIKLGERVNKPILAMVKESKLIKALATNTLLSSDLMTKILLAGAVETACIFVPIAGNIIAAGVSFATTRSVLSKGLDELYKSAKLVVKMAELQ